MSRELLTAAQQSRITTTVTDYLPTDVTVSILRLPSPRTKTKGGGYTQAFAPIASGIPALITPWVGRSGGIEEARDGRFEQTGTWKISLPALTDVMAADKIQSSTGREWEVKVVAAAESLEVLRELICVERLSG